MLDGRVSNGEQVQVDLLNPAYNVEHLDRFAAAWRRVMAAGCAGRGVGDVFPFRVESVRRATHPWRRRSRDLRPLGAAEERCATWSERLWNEEEADRRRREPAARHGRYAR